MDQETAEEDVRSKYGRVTSVGIGLFDIRPSPLFIGACLIWNAKAAFCTLTTGQPYTFQNRRASAINRRPPFQNWDSLASEAGTASSRSKLVAGSQHRENERPQALEAVFVILA